MKQLVRIKNNQGFTLVETMITITIFSIILLVCFATFLVFGRIYFRTLYENRTQEIASNIVDSISEAIRTSGIDVEPLECADNDPYNPDDDDPINSNIENSRKNLNNQFYGFTGGSGCEFNGGKGLWQGYCVGNLGYIVQLNKQATGEANDEVFTVTRDCNPELSARANVEVTRDEIDETNRNIELLAKNMRVVNFSIVEDNDDPRLYRIYLKLAYGGNSKDAYTTDGTNSLEGGSWNEDNADLEKEVFVFEADSLGNLFEPPEPLAKIARCQTGEVFCSVVEFQTRAFKRIEGSS